VVGRLFLFIEKNIRLKERALSRRDGLGNCVLLLLDYSGIGCPLPRCLAGGGGGGALVQFVGFLPHWSNSFFSLFFSGQPQELIRLSGIQEQGAATATAVVASREEDGCASLMLIKKYPRLGRRRRGGGVK
jgi:hypothetical protein